MWATADADELKAVTDAIGNGVLMIEVCGDRRFWILSINRRVEHVSGLCHADVSGRLLEHLLPQPLAAQMAAHYQQCVNRA